MRTKNKANISETSLQIHVLTELSAHGDQCCSLAGLCNNSTSAAFMCRIFQGWASLVAWQPHSNAEVAVRRSRCELPCSEIFSLRETTAKCRRAYRPSVKKESSTVALFLRGLAGTEKGTEHGHFHFKSLPGGRVSYL